MIANTSSNKPLKLKIRLPKTTMSNFTNQVFRKDILHNMLNNRDLPGKELYSMIMSDNNREPDERRQGWIFESICQITIVLKCVDGINYSEIYDGQLQQLKLVNNINKLLQVKVDGGGNNIIDMAIKHDTTLNVFSIKYKNKYSETDVSKIDSTITKQNITANYQIGLIVKDKDVITQHTFKNKMNIDKQLIDTIIENKMLFDENDIINALSVFTQRFSCNTMDINQFIDMINAEYLMSPREQIILKLHQKMTLLRFVNTITTTKHNMFCIAHKPRSGKSITILSIAKYLLEYGLVNKVLVMTSVPATIDSFVDDLEKYIDFASINYKLQDQFSAIDETFNGIVFCSVQYLKTDGKNKKKALLKQIGFDLIITDECHLGGSTDKTKTDILDIDSDIDDIRKTIKMNIFASGTSDKTTKYYRIHSSCIYKWEIEDEMYMKELVKSNVSNMDELMNNMINRHGKLFAECLANETLNKNYSNCPTPVLIKHSIPQTIVDAICSYNSKNGLDFGYSCSSLFALQQVVTDNGEVAYIEEFELCKDNDGIELLKSFFECIISKDRMRKDTIMKHIEHTQTSRSSRKSTIDNPLLFIIYLPTHTGNNTISQLQKTVKQFIEHYDLWSDYNIEYSNSKEDTGYVKEEYNDYIKTIMNKTKIDKKRGCILLLGNKGTVGITYHDCDVTISLDDGHNLDNQKQRFSRAFTEAYGKTIGINVDMNIQRTYSYLIDIIQNHRRNTRTTKSNAEILYYLFEQNIFIFDPQQIHNGTIKTIDIVSYYNNVAENMMKVIDDMLILEQIVCDDDMREFIKLDFHNKGLANIVNPELEGEQKDCPKCGVTKTQIDGLINDNVSKTLTPEDNAIIELMINQTYEMCKSFLFPLLALMSRSYKIFDFIEIFSNEKTEQLLISILSNKQIKLNKDNYTIIVNIMKSIINNNADIINNIREIYSIAPAHKLRKLIEMHFIPTNSEKIQNAEVPTPVKLIDEMLNSIPSDFWKTPKRVFEPCCGKGNFVLGIFDRFYEGLAVLIPDEIDRCRVIMTECIYFADLTSINVFVTTEVMKCHVQSYCGLDELDYVFNSCVCNSLDIDIKRQWGIIGFNAVCGNPPYNSSGDTATGNTIWQDFTKTSINNWLLPGGYLLFVHPPGWRKPNTTTSKYFGLFDLMCKSNQMHYLEIHGIKDGNKTFKCGTRYDWYLIEKTPNYKNTIIIDECKMNHTINLGELEWLPNSNIIEIQLLLAGSDNLIERCPIIYNRSNYGSDNKKYISKNKTDVYKYSVIHTIPLAGVRYIYSSINDKGHFGISKVIFGDNGLNDVIIDMEGQYGMSENSMAIQVDSLEEANNIKRALLSDKFKDIIKCCIIGNFRIDWRLFQEFKKDFWKHFI